MIHQDDMPTLECINNITSKYMKQKLTKLQGCIIDKSTSKMGILKNTCLSEPKRSSKQKITQDMENLNSLINKLDLID